MFPHFDTDNRPLRRALSALPVFGRWIACLAAGLCCIAPAASQTKNNYSSLRTRVVSATIPVQQLDSLTLAPPILQATDTARNTALDVSIFRLSGANLIIDTAALQQLYPGLREIQITYRVLPWNMEAPIARLDTVRIKKRINENAIEYDYTPFEAATKPWETTGLNSSGAYTRGLSFGNSQNLVFNSNLNLQLDGKLGSDLELRAALSDNSIPLQPDGTTRQLKEFDRIFIQLKRRNTALTAGDYDLTRPAGYFSNYFKRLQGAMVESVISRGADTLRVRAAAAVSKGKFSRQIIQGQEGNQGPYRLRGAEGEQFIIVLAGTEKVYVDGIQLRRGLEDDYVIDYNLGELSFTPKRLITKDSRIIVEFEYSVQTYLRSTVAGNSEWSSRKGNLYLNVYSEQDARNNGGAQELSASERGRLAQSGDNLSNAYASGIDTLDTFDPARVLYKQLDTLVCGFLTHVLVYSTHPDSARYAARFTEVPAGQGNYVLVQNAANGRVFRWSPPDPQTCKPTGNFEPVVKLIAPELRQMWTLGGNLKLPKKGKLSAEIGLSNRDLNRFSPLGDRDNLGLAGYFAWNQPFSWGREKSGKNAWQGETSLALEHTGQRFQALNPYRPAEFTRDWNIQGNQDTVAEQIGRAGARVRNAGLGASLQYEFSAFRRQGVYNGQRHVAEVNWKKRGWELQATGNYLFADGKTERSTFERPKVDFSKTFSRNDSTGLKPLFKTGVYFEQERNRRLTANADTLNAQSFWYDLYKYYFQTPEGGKPWQVGGYVSQRNDFAPAGAAFSASTRATEYNLTGAWSNNKSRKKYVQSVDWALTKRQLRIANSLLTKEQAQNTLLGKVNYTLSLLRNALSVTANYELGSGQSPKIQFNYVRVNPGEGQYTWIDRNRDSILQVDEMELAVFADQANFVRVAVTTPDYVRTDNIQFSPSLRFEPRLIWLQPGKAWQRFASRLGTQSNMQISRKTLAGVPGIQTWNPFQLSDIADTALVNLGSAWRNTLFFNRADPKWDASISQGDNRSRLTVTTGYEARRSEDVTVHGRLNLGTRWSVESEVVSSLRASNNQSFHNRDYTISAREAGPKLSWLPSRSLRLTSELKWKNSRNRLGSQETAQQSDFSAELTWNPAAKPNAQGYKASTSLRCKLNFVNIQYSGQSNTAVAFAMLDALQNGKNYIWSVLLDRQLSKTVQLSLNYEGRKSGTARVVHVGRAQVRALF